MATEALRRQPIEIMWDAWNVLLNSITQFLKDKERKALANLGKTIGVMIAGKHPRTVKEREYEHILNEVQQVSNTLLKNRTSGSEADAKVRQSLSDFLSSVAESFQKRKVIKWEEEWNKLRESMGL